MSSQLKAILYYHFATIKDLPAYHAAHKAKCEELGLKGRVLIASEGINGTLAGQASQVAAYQKFVQSYPGFEKVDWKEDDIDSIPFARLRVRLRPFMINMGEQSHLNPEEGGYHMPPHEWRHELEKIAQGQSDAVVLDVRNSYEGAVGRFTSALVPQYDRFADFPKWMEELKAYKDKKILMYCTGGIRCEKFSVLMKKEGFQDVNQLHGGIVRYLKTEGPAQWHGRCFVFDDRMALAPEGIMEGSTSLAPPTHNETPLAQCLLCGTAEDRFVNCANMDCNKLFVVCDACAKSHGGCCSSHCETAPRRRSFDPAHFRRPFRRQSEIPHSSDQS